MSASRIAAIAAIMAMVFWALKAVAIGLAGGLDESALEGPFFVLGLLSFVIAFAAAGFSMATGRHMAVRIALVLAGAVVALVTVAILSDVGRLLPDSTDWAQEEAGLWLASLIGAALILGWQQHQRGKTAIGN